MKAIILTAAKSKDFHPFCETRTKSMSFCSGSSILGRLISQLKMIGIQDICLVVEHQKQKIQDYFNYGEAFGVNLTYIEQNGVGIGNALLQAESFIVEDHFFLVYGDILTTDKHFFSFIPYLKHPLSYSIASLVHPFFKGSFGSAYINHKLKITRIVEKKILSKEAANYVLSGIYLLEKNIFQILKKDENMDHLYQALVKKEKIYANLPEESWVDISYPWNVMDANRIIMDSWSYSSISDTAKIRRDVNIKGIVKIGKNCQILPGTMIQGPCYIGDNVFIGNNCLIRSYSSIEKGSVIGFGTEVKSSILFPNVLIGRLSFIGDSLIGEKTQIGNYCTTVNYNFEKTIYVNNIDTEKTKMGVFVGDQAIIGSNHSLEAGLVIPSNKIIDNNSTLTKNNIE